MIALVAALGGTALAASKLNSTQKKEVEKIAKKYAGKPGAAGAQGPAGPTGSAGKNGTDGTNGTNGKDGTSGKDGKNGTFSTEPLPPEQTLTGNWQVAGPAGHYYAQVSFPMTVSPPPTAVIENNDENYGFLLKEGESTFFPEGATSQEEAEAAWEASCPGDASHPEAAPGFLCIYYAGAEHGFITRLSTQFELAHEFGVLVPLELGGTGTEEAFIKGSWAVTGQ
jgi:hypothetical protein